MGCCALGLWRLARRPGQGRFSETSDWGSARIRVRAGWKTGTFRFVNLLGMGKRFLSLTCTQPDGSESHPCALQSSVLFQGERPWPLAADVPART